MNCKEVREQASAYLDQELGPADAAQLEQHLVGCVDCRQEIETLRKTVSLVGGLDPIETSTNFLGKVHEKIERGAKPRRIWAWLFEPLKVKVPLEVAGLLLVSTMTLYFYFKSPELSGESGVLAPLEGLKVARDEAKEKSPASKGKVQERYELAQLDAPDLKAEQSRRSLEVVRGASEASRMPTPQESSKVAQNELRKKDLEMTALGKKTMPRERNRMAESEPGTTKKLETQLSRHGYMEQANKSVEKLVPSVPEPEIHEVTVDDVFLYERRVEDLLKKAGGSLLSQEGSSESGLLLTVVLPQSRQAEFLAALKEEVKAESKIAELRRGAVGDSKEEVQKKGAAGVVGGRLVYSEKTLDRMDMATVTLQLRILPKK
jgi:hypothetical protein